MGPHSNCNFTPVACKILPFDQSARLTAAVQQGPSWGLLGSDNFTGTLGHGSDNISALAHFLVHPSSESRGILRFARVLGVYSCSPGWAEVPLVWSPNFPLIFCEASGGSNSNSHYFQAVSRMMVDHCWGLALTPHFPICYSVFVLVIYLIPKFVPAVLWQMIIPDIEHDVT